MSFFSHRPKNSGWGHNTTTGDALLPSFDKVDLNPAVRAKHEKKLDHLIRELVVNAKQLRDVGGDESKLTADYVRQWDQNKADLSVMPSEAVKLAEEELR